MPATTLFKMATQAAIRLAAQINDIADMPYRIARPILLKIQSPQQLHDIEINCPHIAESSEELWRAFIARDIPDHEKKMVLPKNKNSWHKVYRFLQRKEEQKAAEDEEALRKTLAGEGLKKAEKETLFVKKILPHARSEDEHNLFIDGVARRDVNDWGIPKKAPTLKNAKTGDHMMAAIRRKAADNAKAKSMAKPFTNTSQQQAYTQRLANAKRQISEAPQSMLRQTHTGPANRPLTIAPRDPLPHEKVMMAEYKKAQATKKIQPPTRLANAKIAERNQQAVENATRIARAENEAKLRALTQSHKRKRDSTAASPPSRAFDFAPSPNVTDAAKRASPATSPPAAASAASPPKQPVATNTSKAHLSPEPSHKVPQAASASPETSPPPKPLARKRPPPASIFMTNKKRKI